jgi:hypothetical protein
MIFQPAWNAIVSLHQYNKADRLWKTLRDNVPWAGNVNVLYDRECYNNIILKIGEIAGNKKLVLIYGTPGIGNHCFFCWFLVHIVETWATVPRILFTVRREAFNSVGDIIFLPMEQYSCYDGTLTIRLSSLRLRGWMYVLHQAKLWAWRWHLICLPITKSSRNESKNRDRMVVNWEWHCFTCKELLIIKPPLSVSEAFFLSLLLFSVAVLKTLCWCGSTWIRASTWGHWCQWNGFFFLVMILKMSIIQFAGEILL